MINITVKYNNKLSFKHMLPIWSYKALESLFNSMDVLREYLNGASATSKNAKRS